MGIADDDLERLLLDLESDRVERKQSASATERISEAICAFANDMPDHQQPGVIFVGVDDRGRGTNLPITDNLLLTLSGLRDNGNLVPIPTMTVEKKAIAGRDVACVVVQPSHAPPVRFKGTVWVRVGPRRARATADEERRLAEKRRTYDVSYDLAPLRSAALTDLDEDLFRREYLPHAVDEEALRENRRTLDEQLRALRFASVDAAPVPTVLGVLVLGRSPADFVPGAYIQFLRLDGDDLASPIRSQEELHGPLAQLLNDTDRVLKANISTATDITSGPLERRAADYPLAALQQIVRNAVMHRAYDTSYAPVRINWFSDRIEVHSPGGPFGQVNSGNFGEPGVTDYRNPHVAEAMRNLGFVQRFGVGIATARRELERNGNPPPVFDVQPSFVAVTLRKRT